MSKIWHGLLQRVSFGLSFRSCANFLFGIVFDLPFPPGKRCNRNVRRFSLHLPFPDPGVQSGLLPLSLVATLRSLDNVFLFHSYSSFLLSLLLLIHLQSFFFPNLQLLLLN